MNIHKTLDDFTITIASLAAGKNKFFSKSISTSTFLEYFESISLELPDIHGEGEYTVKAETLIGQIDAAFFIYKWKGANYPTIIYHHGNNEQPFNLGRFSKNSFKKIFVDNKNKRLDCNLIALRAPFHDFSLKQYMEKISKLSHFVAMLSVSVILAERITQFLDKNMDSEVLLSGISLGGWVTNLHRTYYNTADMYIPLLAGAALDDIFITSIYEKMTGNIAKENSDFIRKILNFEDDFRKVKDDNVFPLLGKYDQIIKYERQKLCYEDKPINVLEKGHITASLASEELFNHVAQILNKKD